MLLGVDVGGTFTDAVLYDGHRLHTAKAPTTPDDQSRGVIAAIESVLERSGADAADIESFAHGMTVGTNALLEKRGARTALVATEASPICSRSLARHARAITCTPTPEPLAPADLRSGSPRGPGRGA